MKIGILSDTHNMLRPEIVSILQKCDCILHSGDIGSPSFLEQINAIAPTIAVRGNNDKDRSLPIVRDIQIDGLHICMAHKKNDLPHNLNCYDIAICGHTHQYEEKQADIPIILNPGSCGPCRFQHPVTMAVIQSEKDHFSIQKIEIRHAEPNGIENINNMDIRKQITIIIRETQKGKTTDEIAVKFDLEKTFTEQVARLFVTHPGITPDGIMSKMGLYKRGIHMIRSIIHDPDCLAQLPSDITLHDLHIADNLS